MDMVIAQAVRIAYPGAVLEHEGAPFKRPAWTEDDTEYASGFYWINLDGDRFYFQTFAEAAEDLSYSLGMGEEEARAIVAARRTR